LAVGVIGGRPPTASEVPLPVGIAWDELRATARRVAEHAFAPYSGLHVGAAGLTDDGAMVAGCNVENASFGMTLCAECGLVSALRAAGGQRLVAISVVAGDGQPLAPCGRCRQVLLDNGGPTLLIDCGPGRLPVALEQLLPGAFDAEELFRRSPL
jgi:cytidine deaminase